MFKLEFDATNKALALVFGKALLEYSKTGETQTVVVQMPGAVHNVEVVGAVTTKEMVGEIVQDLAGAAHTQMDGEFTGSTETSNSAEAGANTSQKLDYDTKGVPFIPAICAKAVKPFYASGPYVGQWKKGTKVDQAEYDRVYGEALAKVVAGQQTSVGEQIQNSPAAEVFANVGNAIDQTIAENPVTANDVFTLYGELCANNGAVAANGICAAAGIENGTLIFSRPDLVDELFKSLTTLKHALANQGG